MQKEIQEKTTSKCREAAWLYRAEEWLNLEAQKEGWAKIEKQQAKRTRVFQ